MISSVRRVAMRASPGLIALALELVLLVYVLRPLLWSSYSGDDVVASQRVMWRAYTGTGFWEHFLHDNSYWGEVHGRFFPLSLLQQDGVFQLFQTRLAYKWVQLLYIVIAWALVVTFVRVLLKSWEYAAIAGGAAVLAMQFRAFHDPLLQFHAQQALVVSAFFGALTLVVVAARAKEGRRFGFLVGAMGLAWVVGLLTYETLYPLVVIPVGLIVLTMTGRRRTVALAATLTPTIVLLGYIVILRSAASAPSPAYLLGFDSWRIFPAFAKQATGVLPFSYQLLDESPGGAGGIVRVTSGWSVAGRWDLIALATSVLLAAVVVLRFRPAAADPVLARFLRRMGWLVIVVPSVTVAMTQRWQNDGVKWGKPYVSVFFASMGLVLLLVGWLADKGHVGGSERDIVGRLWRRTLAGLAIVVVILGPIVIEDTNRAVVDHFSGLRWEREAFEAQIRGDVFSQVPDGSLVVADEASEWFWVNGSFVQWYGGPPQLRFVTPDHPAAAECGLTRDCYRYTEEVLDDGTLWGVVTPMPATR